VKAPKVWPDHIIKLAGAWKDLPTAKEIPKNKGKAGRRISLWKMRINWMMSGKPFAWEIYRVPPGWPGFSNCNPFP